MTVQLGGAAGPRYRVMEEFASLAPIGVNQEAIRRVCVAFGPVILSIETYGSALCNVALDPLRHAALSHETATDLHLVLIDGKDTGFDVRTISDLVRNGDCTRRPGSGFDSGRPRLRANVDWNTYCLIEEEKRRIIVWFADASAVPEWVVYDQIRNALHWLSLGRGFGMFHAAALRLGETGCLIAGKSGSGKSTFTAAAIAGDFSSAGDDFVLVETATFPPRVHAVFDTIKLDEDGLTRFSQFRPFVRNPARGRTEKSIFHMYDSAPDRIATGFLLHAILHARLTGQRQSRIVKSAPSAAFLALAPSSLLLLRTQGKDVSTKCATLVGGLDCYIFEIGTNLEAAVDELTSFMRDREPRMAPSI
jgi:hypothetical protein